MRVLALDTTTRTGSVALLEDDRVIAERTGDASRTYAERLPGELAALLDEVAMRSSDVDLFAVASGPGSFTGLRVGIATMQGLAFVHRRPVAAVSALDALGKVGAAGAAPGAYVGTWMDAHRHDVFTALYRSSRSAVMAGPDASDGDPTPRSIGLVEIEGPQVGEPAMTLDRWAGITGGESLVFIGDGASMWTETIRARHPAAAIAPHPLLAGAIGRIAVARGLAAALDPADVRPLYIRRPDAEIAREARALERQAAPGRGT